MEKNVIVMDDQCKRQIGTTYPKRAKGMIKNGRAEFIDDSTIRLLDPCPADILEDNRMENYIFFNAREWKFNLNCTSNQGSRNSISGFDGKIAEAYTIGSWDVGGGPTEIQGPLLTLEENTEYKFIFWLNGGENDRNGDEVCQLQIVFDTDRENALVYNLNRNFIQPLKRVRGWNLYEIPFNTDKHKLTQMMFIAKAAPTTIMPALEAEAYADVEDELDEFEGIRPQRHNIVWSDGWPSNTWYSTKALRRKYDNNKGEGRTFEMPPIPSMPKFFGHEKRNSDVRDMNALKEMILDEIDMDELKEQIIDELDVDDLKERIIDELDFDGIRESIVQQVVEALKGSIHSDKEA